MLLPQWYAPFIYGLAGFGCAVLVYLIARSIARTWQDLKILAALLRDEDKWQC